MRTKLSVPLYIIKKLIKGIGFRYSSRPSKQLVWYWLMRDMRLSNQFEVGVDAGCGLMENRPWFRTKKYIGIDLDEYRLKTGKAKYPEAEIIRGRLEEIENVFGGFVLCVQVLTANNVDPEFTMPVVKSLVQMVEEKGVLVFNISKMYLGYEKEIDNHLCQYFSVIKKLKYGALSGRDTCFAPLIALFMYFIPFLRYGKNYTKIYYICIDRDLGKNNEE